MTQISSGKIFILNLIGSDKLSLCFRNHSMYLLENYNLAGDF